MHSQSAQQFVITKYEKNEFIQNNPSRSLEVTSEACFKELILFIPSFQQISKSYRKSPAIKMLEESFKFSLKMPIKIKMDSIKNGLMCASVIFQGQTISKASGMSQLAKVEACVKALELLSKTCYTIQAKEDHLSKCRLLDVSELKLFDSNKWETVRQKYPNIHEVTKNNDIQKTFSIFLDSHTSSGSFEDIVCCNLTKKNVNDIRSVVKFFHLTMLAWCVTTELSNNQTHFNFLIQKHRSAKELLEVLTSCGGENDKFRLYAPNTFKDFYKLHPNYWDTKLQNSDKTTKLLESKTTLNSEELKLFLNNLEKREHKLSKEHALIPKNTNLNKECEIRKSDINLMKDIFDIDSVLIRHVPPDERMEQLLNKTTLLKKYENRVFELGQPNYISTYHNYCSILSKEIDYCLKEINKGQEHTATEEVLNTYKPPLSEPDLSSLPESQQTLEKILYKSSGQRRSNDSSWKRSVHSSMERQRSRSPVNNRNND